MNDGKDEVRPVSLLFPRSSSSTSVNKTGIWSLMRPRTEEKTAPCSAACPCGQDIPRIEMLVSRERFAAAWRTILAENPLPGTCGRVCFHPCEKACNRGEFDESVSINALERFLDDTAGTDAISDGLEPGSPKGRKIAVVGSGPAGLAAAYFLARLGYACEIFEAAEAPGGVLRYGIPSYRLPKETLDREIRRIERQGVVFRCSRPVDAEFLADARGRYDAVFLGCGHGKPMTLGIPGEDLASDGLAFLKWSNSALKDRPGAARRGAPVLVVGGGNTAVDVARSLLRAGARPTIVYRRRREDMPAFGSEVARAMEEGVRIVELSAPLSLVRRGNGLELKVQKMQPTRIGPDGRMRVAPLEGQTEIMTAEAVYPAIGAAAGESWMVPADRPDVLRLSHCAAAWTAAAGLPVLYGGDTVNRDESVADAVASGKQAAIALDVFFTRGPAAVEAEIARCRLGDGTSLSMEIYLGGARKDRTTRIVRSADLNLDYFSPSRRERGSMLPPAEAIGSCAEVESSLKTAGAVKQADRCFNCGLCNDCDNCRTFCPEAAVIAARAARSDDWADEPGPDRRINADYCKGCGVCFTECPRGAMVIEEQPS